MEVPRPEGFVVNILVDMMVIGGPSSNMGVVSITSLCMNVKIGRRKIIVRALFVCFQMSLAMICISANLLRFYRSIKTLRPNTFSHHEHLGDDMMT